MSGGKPWLAKIRVHGLVWKQSMALLAIAMVVGLISSVFEIQRDLQSERGTIGRTTLQILAMVNATASEAAYQLNRELATKVVNGVLQYEAIRQVSLQDNFGAVMAHAERSHAESTLGLLADRLFADTTDYLVPLFYRGSNGVDEAVGEISVSLDPRHVASGFFNRAGLILLVSLARTLGVCAICVVVFSLIVTRPLLRLQGGISRVDPAAPGRGVLPQPQGRRQGDELAILTETLNGLLLAFQRGLEARDTAEVGLKEMARTLEQRVHQRTEELAREKEGVEQALLQLNAAHAQLNKANSHINESIRYASRIQTSLLPDNSSLSGLLYDIAIGWAPRDVVGGDFYWVGRFGERCVVALMDCTGHGVPGAFMTAIVASVLDRILHEHCHDDPARILQMLNRLVKSSLHQDELSNAGAFLADDGLDAAVCLIDSARRCLTFAGARIPLLCAHDGGILEIKGDRHSLGYRSSQSDYSFTNHHLVLQPGMSFYLFTDGVTDQVGGPHRRLFGRRRLAEALRRCHDAPMRQQMDTILTRLAEYRGIETPRDDMTFIGFTPLPPQKTLAWTGDVRSA